MARGLRVTEGGKEGDAVVLRPEQKGGARVRPPGAKGRGGGRPAGDAAGNRGAGSLHLYQWHLSVNMPQLFFRSELAGQTGTESQSAAKRGLTWDR